VALADLGKRPAEEGACAVPEERLAIVAHRAVDFGQAVTTLISRVDTSEHTSTYTIGAASQLVRHSVGQPELIFSRIGRVQERSLVIVSISCVKKRRRLKDLPEYAWRCMLENRSDCCTGASLQEDVRPRGRVSPGDWRERLEMKPLRSRQRRYAREGYAMLERDERGCIRFAVPDNRKAEVLAVEGALGVGRASTRRRKLFISSPGCGGEGPTPCADPGRAWPVSPRQSERDDF
jgi:hypothetical protein